MQLNLYLLSQNSNSNYDTFDSAVVCAKNIDDAKKIHPHGCIFGSASVYNSWSRSNDWVDSPDEVQAEYIGIADVNLKENDVIISSFNAG